MSDCTPTVQETLFPTTEEIQTELGNLKKVLAKKDSEISRLRSVLENETALCEEWRAKNSKIELDLKNARAANKDFLKERDEAVRKLEKRLRKCEKEDRLHEEIIKQMRREVSRIQNYSAGLAGKNMILSKKIEALEAESAQVRELAMIESATISNNQRNSSETDYQKKVGDWNVRRDRRGYFRMYRRVNGKTLAGYVGKVFDLEKAVTEVARLNTKHGLT